MCAHLVSHLETRSLWLFVCLLVSFVRSLLRLLVCTLLGCFLIPLACVLYAFGLDSPAQPPAITLVRAGHACGFASPTPRETTP